MPECLLSRHQSPTVTSVHRDGTFVPYDSKGGRFAAQPFLAICSLHHDSSHDREAKKDMESHARSDARVLSNSSRIHSLISDEYGFADNDAFSNGSELAS